MPRLVFLDLVSLDISNQDHLSHNCIIDVFDETTKSQILPANIGLYHQNNCRMVNRLRLHMNRLTKVDKGCDCRLCHLHWQRDIVSRIFFFNCRIMRKKNVNVRSECFFPGIFRSINDMGLITNFYMYTYLVHLSCTWPNAVDFPTNAL